MASRPLPERIGKYAIESVLGHGAMGVVYKGFDPHIHRPVAIKTIHKHLLGDGAAFDSIAARFRNEAQAVGRVAHPGVVAIYELGEHASDAFIAMEYVDGRGLDQVLAATPLLPEAQLLSVMDQLLDALGAAHRHGVWHRDVKPANLLLSATGQLKLTDFGIARIENVGLTQVSVVIGTPGYMSPEQYVGEGVDQRSDLFAAGVVLYRLLAGRPAFIGTAQQVMYQILHEQPTAPSRIAAERRSAAFDTVVERAMAKRAADRFESAAAFREALRSAAERAADDGFATTQIVPQALWTQTIAAAARMAPRPASPPSTSSPSSSAAPITGWDQPSIHRLERSLAGYVGPMARLMVRDAARHCNDLASLAHEVAQHIGEPAQRQRFVLEVTGGTAASAARPATAAQSVPQGPATRSGMTQAPALPAADAPLGEPLKAHAQQVLSRHLGPIARVVVKRAADRSASRNGFIDAVLAACPELDVETLRRELQAG